MLIEDNTLLVHYLILTYNIIQIKRVLEFQIILVKLLFYYRIELNYDKKILVISLMIYNEILTKYIFFF